MSSFAHFVQHAHFILFLDFHPHNLQSMNDASDRLRISSGILPVNMFCLKKKTFNLGNDISSLFGIDSKKYGIVPDNILESSL